MNKIYISIIWGYSTHMYSFAPEENYHLHALQIAKSIGYKPYALVRDGKSNMEKDPHFDPDITVIDYKNAFQFFFHVLLFSLKGAVFYVNSYEWQSFVIPFLVRKSIFMAHTQPKRQTELKQKVQNFVYRFFTRIRLNNETEKNFLIKEGTPEKKLFVVPLVVAQDTFKLLTPEQTRTDLVYFGNITAKKNVITIIKAFELVKEDMPDIKLNLVGTMWDTAVEAAIAHSPFKKDIICHGFLPNDAVVKELNRNLIYLNASLDEGQCVAVYDAALCGCALCLPNIMSFIDVYKNKALFHDIFDHQTLAKNILFYVKNPETLKKHTAACRTMIQEQYSKETVEKQMKNLFSI